MRDRHDRPSVRCCMGGSLAIVGLISVLATACPFCGVVGRSLAERRDAAAVTAVGEAAGPAVRGADGLGITVCYWDSEEAIAGWRAHVEHAEARAQGKARWYAHYELRVAKVERAYGGPHA